MTEREISNKKKKQLDSPLVHNFLRKYDDDFNLTFNNIKYRQGAKITASFGLARGYRYEHNKELWDTVRIHTGVDRAILTAIPNVVYSPFDFDKSMIYDYGASHVYGSVIRLISTKYKFELRIMHLNPSTDIEKNVLDLLQKGKPIPRDTLIGRSGDYGFGTGIHTHTELVSTEETSPLLESLLFIKYGFQSTIDYTESEIIDYYKNTPYWRDCTSKAILSNFEELKKQRRIVGIINKYKYMYKDYYNNYNKTTRYSTELVFNGM